MSIPAWAKQAHDDWQTAIEAALRVQQKYNDWLSKLDRIHFVSQDESEPLLKKFQDLNAQLNSLVSLQIQYFQQITPWMDAKIQELRSEENHNVTYHVGDLIGKLNDLQLQIAALERRVRNSAVHPPARQSSSASESPVVQRSDKDFRYHTFEQIFRAPAERLKESMHRYLPLFVNAPEPVLDLGCGRGEFLQLMKEAAKNAYGIDFSEYEVERLKASGLQAVAGDIQEHLQKLEDESVGGVFCGQVVEHLHPDTVYDMLAMLHRAMKAGSPLVIETVNPVSVFAYHELFFKDPTHIFPVHPDTLMFMLRYSGFQNVQAHAITPVPEQQKLPEPKQEDFDPAAYEYLKAITGRLNQLLYDSMEYYVVGIRT